MLSCAHPLFLRAQQQHNAGTPLGKKKHRLLLSFPWPLLPPRDLPGICSTLLEQPGFVAGRKPLSSSAGPAALGPSISASAPPVQSRRAPSPSQSPHNFPRVGSGRPRPQVTSCAPLSQGASLLPGRSWTSVWGEGGRRGGENGRMQSVGAPCWGSHPSARGLDLLLVVTPKHGGLVDLRGTRSERSGVPHESRKIRPSRREPRHPLRQAPHACHGAGPGKVATQAGVDREHVTRRMKRGGGGSGCGSTAARRANLSADLGEHDWMSLQLRRPPESPGPR